MLWRGKSRTKEENQVAILNTVVRVGHIGRMRFEKDLKEVRESAMNIWGKSFPGS